MADDKALRILTVMDESTHEGLAVDVALTTSAERVISVLSGLIAQHGSPAYLRSDNGAEFVAAAVQAWLTQCGVQDGLVRRPGQTAGSSHRKLTVFGSHVMSACALEPDHLGAALPDPQPELGAEELFRRRKRHLRPSVVVVS